MTEPLTITVEDAARLLGISRGLAYEAARRGELPTIRLGRRLLVPTARLYDLVGAPETREAGLPGSTSLALTRSSMETVPPERDSGLEPLGESDAFIAELERLASLAPEPWRSELLSLARRVESEERDA
jgi:excisionase family DNA binding protein